MCMCYDAYVLLSLYTQSVSVCIPEDESSSLGLEHQGKRVEIVAIVYMNIIISTRFGFILGESFILFPALLSGQISDLMIALIDPLPFAINRYL